MLDFLMISTRVTKRGVIEIYPKFVIRSSQDLMIRGGDFYAIWVEERNLWSTEEQDAIQLIDKELDIFAKENSSRFDSPVKVLHLWDAETGMIDKWHRYCQKQLWDSYHTLDETLIFSNTDVKKSDYASKKLSYPLEEGDLSAYNKLMTTLYSEQELQKIEWSIGAVVTGDSKTIQKFLVLYGSAGTGKSTVLNIIQQLFDGYYSVFDAKALGSSTNAFALEAFKTNPLVAIQHDGDLSRIEDNTRLNSLVSHELMTVNEKFKSTYTSRFKCFLFMGTNKPVKITDAKSGLIRRLIDVRPTGNKLSQKEYKMVVSQISFELGAIAWHCRDVYLSNPSLYDNYIPVGMLSASNDFYNFVEDSYYIFKKDDSTSLKSAWEMYNTYCERARVAYPMSQKAFREELKNYFDDYKDRIQLDDGSRPRSFYSGFKADKFESVEETEDGNTYILQFNSNASKFDELCAACPAQYANTKETPSMAWAKVSSTLSDIDTSKLHYVRIPENHIVIDFDIPDESGKKCFEKNLEAASKWPPTYAELSKSEAGIHLHYIYTGDVSKLCALYAPHIEIKVFTGKSSLRRKLTKCNTLPIREISSGLPLKEKEGDIKMVDTKTIRSELGLRQMIKRNLNKEIHPSTTQSINFIKHILDEAYESGMPYDVSDMYPAIISLASKASNQAEHCLKTCMDMKLVSENPAPETEDKQALFIFYDIEVFPNVFCICYKVQGDGKPVLSMINPSRQEIEDFLKFNLIGFNCRRYDNHILYAVLLGYSPHAIYELSQNIVNSKRGNLDVFFRDAYNLSYTDVFDFCSTKQSLKKWEIELGIHHQELGFPWDEEVEEERWPTVIDYCKNDVLATEAVFNARQGDFKARLILVDLAGHGKTPNNTTNSLTEAIVFGDIKDTQPYLKWRNMGELDGEPIPEPENDDGYTMFDSEGRPVFPGYTYKNRMSTYRGEKVGEGGAVYAEPAIYTNVVTEDIASMHPTSIYQEDLFSEYTSNFYQLVEARIAIKHKDFDKARTLMDGKLAKYLDNEDDAEDLSYALKIAINSVYGLTAASFKNRFKSEKNVDNIVAKRGALFMINLRHEVQKRGYTVAHIKTDSIKIPNASIDILNFVEEYGKLYGYNFELESLYEKMCIVNDAVFVAKYATTEQCEQLYGTNYVHKTKDTFKKNKKKGGQWTATGTEFQVPFVFKTLFSHEPLEFKDFCCTFSSKTALYLDMNEGYPDVSEAEKELSKLETKYKKGLLSDTSFEPARNELCKEIATGHNYIFIGRDGQFCPIKDGHGGGVLYYKKNNKYYAVGGTTGYRWLESESIKLIEKEESICTEYFESMADAAKDHISQYGDFDAFASNKPYEPDFMNIPVTDNEETPF